MQYYYTIEIEATNYCNARCVFCANKTTSRTRGFIKLERFQELVDLLQKTTNNNIFRAYGITSFPRITFCGLGDPLLHPEISELIGLASKARFYTQLVTNGAALSEKLSEELCKNGLQEICFSLHSVNPVNYKAITGIELKPTLLSIGKAIPIFQKHGVNMAFWRIYHPDSAFRDSLDDEIHYQMFLKSYGIPNDLMLGPSEPWSRNGVVPNSKCQVVQDSPFWCNKILFTFNVDWKGNVVLCCNDYCDESNLLGNVFDPAFSFDSYFQKKLKVLQKKALPEMCLHCKRWPDTEIMSILQQNNIDEEAFIEKIQKSIETGDKEL